MRAKRHLTAFILLLIVSALFALSAEAVEPASGSIGDDLSWTLDEVGTLTISGSGAVPGNNSPVVQWNEAQEVRSIVILPGVTGIGSYSFAFMWNLEVVSIPDSLITIGESPFYSCENLRQIDVAEQNPAFASVDGVLYNRGMTELILCPAAREGGISIPDRVTRIKEGAFPGCKKLTHFEVSENNPAFASVDGVLCNRERTTLIKYPELKEGSFTIPFGVTEIADQAFLFCSGLTAVQIPDSVISIGASAFSTCDRLESVSFGNGVQEIGDGAFSQCSSLGSVTLPQGLTSIGHAAFSGCSGMVSLTIPDSVSELDPYTFAGCVSLETLSIGSGVTSFEYYTFEDCADLKEILISEDNLSYASRDGLLYDKALSTLLICPRGRSGECAIPETVRQIDPEAFAFCTRLSGVSIPDGVTEIGVSTFYGCTALENVSIGSGLLSIGTSAFAECESLEEIDLPDSLRSIGSYAFSGCASLRSIRIPEQVTRLDYSVFQDCDSLKSVSFSGAVTSIALGAFRNCSALERVEISDLASWCALSFSQKEDNPLWYAHRLYLNGEELTDLVVPEGVKQVGYYAFCGCSSLRTVTVPGSVTSVCMGTFSECLNIADLNLEDGLLTIMACAFQGCSALTDITIPESVIGIGNNAFENCSGLISVKLPSGSINIEYSLFSGCSRLLRVYIPAGVIRIYDNAFAGCYMLADIFCGGGVEQWEEMAIGEGNDPLFLAHFHDHAGRSDMDDPQNCSSSVYGMTLYTFLAYEVILDRTAGDEEALYWVEQLDSGASAGELIRAFFASDEYRSKGLANRETVIRCYRAMLIRDPDEREIANWTELLDDGYSPSKLAAEFTASEEFRKICASLNIRAGTLELDARDQNSSVTRFVQRCYAYALDRQADEGGLNEWCAHILTRDLTPERVAFGLIFSDEAKARGLSDEAFIRMLYRMMLDREADADGLANWVSALQQNAAAEIAYDAAFGTGRSVSDAIDQVRQDIYALFAASDEFALMCANFGL